VNLDAETEKIGRAVLDAAFEVHKQIGPGLLESAYEACLERELHLKGYTVYRQIPLPIRYKDIQLDEGYRLDLIVEERIIVELKALNTLTPIHDAQLISYLKLSGYRLGFLINFHERRLKDGLRRFVN
jgi:GxxExxY protein